MNDVIKYIRYVGERINSELDLEFSYTLLSLIIEMNLQVVDISYIFILPWLRLRLLITLRGLLLLLTLRLWRTLGWLLLWHLRGHRRVTQWTYSHSSRLITEFNGPQKVEDLDSLEYSNQDILCDSAHTLSCSSIIGVGHVGLSLEELCCPL